MRRKLVAGNWKMYTTPEKAMALAKGVADFVGQATEPQVVIFPPFTSLPCALTAVKGTPVAVGAQNMHWEDEGAFTGEVSGRMLLTLGCTYVILGHSERRQLFFETDMLVNQKLMKALSQDLIPIVCVGETLDQRDAGETMNVVQSQLLGSLDGVPADELRRTVIAYEPVWAIGTGRTASPHQAEEVHGYIRTVLRERYGAIVDDVLILYGGSVKPDNARELFGQPNIDGGLVGGASLTAESFNKIIAAARQ
ncbi:MAG: triose-phosphate isomerase [candidate division Zixibacteria bacterium]|jgi:triosephosphate isomerase (TIM)|nr:triose-phosphate isomerase [candidate division Zixibacteria bacterium]